MNKVIRLTESDLHRIVKESVNKILSEVDGYEKTMAKANPSFDNGTVRGKLTRLLKPNKAKQFDRIHHDAKERFDTAKKDWYRNFEDNFPNASDPYNTPSQEDIEKLDKDGSIMRKYNLGPNGKRAKYL